MMDVDKLANFIRKVNGNNTMGAGALADEIAMFLAQQQASTAQEQAASVPAGWKLVPIKPTQSMNSAGYMRNLELGSAKRSADETYKAMLASAPAPPVAPAHAHSERSEETLTDAEIDVLAVESGANTMVSCMTHPKGPRTAFQFSDKDGSLYRFARAIAAHLSRKG